jgi:hypothetical protein
MISEKVEPQSLVACGSSAGGDDQAPINWLNPFFGLCCR